MTNALAHDLKTPLSIISGYTQNLIENIHTEKREYFAGKIQDNVTRMDKIIKEMLEVSRLEDGLYPSKTEELSLYLISLEIINRYQQVSEENSIKTLLEGDALVLGDESFIIRVIDNFYINALEHTKVGGSIQITINDSVFEIFNSGSHVPDDMLDEIWLPYKKVDESRSNTKGTGLGLSIARTILDYYNYSYGVRNTEDGVVFWFRLQR
jgi:signal transduction histidine kinase